jgi:flagellar biogenesis protein FliO
LFKCIRIFLFLLVTSALSYQVQAAPQAPPPSPSEKELQAPLTLSDEKPAQGQPYPEPSGWRALGSIVVVLILAGGGLWAFRKWGIKRLPGSGGTRLKIEETLTFGDRRHVSILKADDEQFLIAVSPQGIQLLARLDGVSRAAPGDFGHTLEHQMELNRPMPVKEMEAMMRGDQP